MVFREYPRYPLVLPDGSLTIMLAPMLVRDLTRGAYAAKLCFGLPDDYERQVRETHKEDAGLVLSITEAEKAAGNLIYGDQALECRPPFVLAV
jgi:hypothetical protein